MNKFLIILLAVCLVSVHGFVRRDAPAPPPVNDLTQQVQAIQAQLKDAGDKIAKGVEEYFNPDTMKKRVTDIIDFASKTINDIKAKTENKPAA